MSHGSRSRPADRFRSLHADEVVPHVVQNPQTFYEEGARAGRPAPGSLKVGWTVRNHSNEILRGFAFLINPQGLTRADGTRSQVSSTKGGHYVDDFGPAPARIQLRQLVADGKHFDGGFYTHREDVQRFLERIYLPATKGQDRGKLRVFFHDNHFERGSEERVYFPPDALQLERSVELANVWRLDLQMVSLEKYPLERDIDAQPSPNRVRQGKRYTVRRGDTLGKIARRVAGPRASQRAVRRVREQILDLNPEIRRRRRLPDGKRWGKPMRVYVGEIIRLPR